MDRALREQVGVGLAEAEGVEIVEAVRRWIVVVGEPEVEGQLHRAADRLGGDPRQRGDLPIDAHAHMITDKRVPGTRKRSGSRGRVPACPT